MLLQLLERLRTEITATRRLVRHHEEAGDHDQASIIVGRLSGLLYAQRLLGGTSDGCTHPTHTPAGIDENLKTIWLCTTCGERA